MYASGSPAWGTGAAIDLSRVLGALRVRHVRGHARHGHREGQAPATILGGLAAAFG
jgi:hypothetical protein